MIISYFSIYDHDIHDYLHTGLNSKTKRECLEDYLEYRSNDLGEWFSIAEHNTDEFNNLIKITTEEKLWNNENYFWDKWKKQVSEKFILDDMDACNFILEEHSELKKIE